MSLEIIRWIANELRLALLEEDAGAVRGNVEALERLGGEVPGDLFEAATALLGEVDADTLEGLVDAARKGVEGSMAPRPGVRVLAVPNASKMAEL